MRGKDLHFCSCCADLRITPAYAGKSIEEEWVIDNIKDHPRLCGEKNADSTSVVMVRGSPPPMRGKVNGIGIRAQCAGITPAYAGKSLQNVGTFGGD